MYCLKEKDMVIKVHISTNGLITEHKDMLLVRLAEGDSFTTNASYISANGEFYKICEVVV